MLPTAELRLGLLGEMLPALLLGEPLSGPRKTGAASRLPAVRLPALRLRPSFQSPPAGFRQEAFRKATDYAISVQGLVLKKMTQILERVCVFG